MNNNRNNNNRRGRGRPSNNNRGPAGGNQANRIDNRARGNAPQMLDKYKKLAQDAQHNDDRVQAEYYLQFADHYFRVIADNKARQDESRAKRQDERGDSDGDNAEGSENEDRRPNQRRPNDRNSNDRNSNDRPREDRPREDRQPNSRGRGRSRRDENLSDDRPRSVGHEGETQSEGGHESKPVATEVKRPRKPRVAKPRADSSDSEIDASALPPSIGSIPDDEAPAKPKRAPRRRKLASDDSAAEAVS